MRFLQIFNFKLSRYERPNQNWICGRVSRGESCPAGPDAKGQCRGTFECRPVKKGDRWHCARPATLGGSCFDGPTPVGACQHPIPKCAPIRTLRSWRGIANRLAVAAALAFVALILGARKGQQVVSAGNLSSAHSLFNHRCSECHASAVADAAAIDWLASESSSPHASSRMCLRCHSAGKSPNSAHALPAAELVRVSSKSDRPDNLECSVCHKEHRGKNHSLTKIPEADCQTCHATQFTSFSNGHPPFKNYPFERRTRLIFDHTSHFKTHFKDPAFASHNVKSCSYCHSTDPVGGRMIVEPFEQSCAACHEKQIRGIGRAGPPGVAFLRVPGLDAETLNEGDNSIGDWPEDADGALTPFMALLLSVKPEVAGAAGRLEKVDLLDLSKAKDPVLADAAILGWAVKDLLHDFASRGHVELEDRLKAVFKRELTGPEKSALFSHLSPFTIKAAAQAWFPNLEKEVAQHRAGKKVEKAAVKAPPSPAPIKGLKPEDWVGPGGGWYRSDPEFTLFYRPGGHADAFFKVWLDESSHQTNIADIFAAVGDPKAPGYCMKCHSLDGGSDGNIVNWKVRQFDPELHEFTHFSHTSHFSLLDQAGCLTCHPLDLSSGPKYAAAFDRGQTDPAKFQPNFLPLKTVTCASCHNSKSAGESCLTCHNYHVGRFISTMAQGASKSRL